LKGSVVFQQSEKQLRKMNSINKIFQNTKRQLCLIRKYSSSVHEVQQQSNTNEPIFKNVKLVTPQNLEYFLYNQAKLKFVSDDEKTKSKLPGIEILRNIAANYDYWIVRSQQDMLLYYRLQMMQQRLDYLKPIGLDHKQKLRDIQKSPPAVMFTFSGSTFESKMVYLRGLSPTQTKNQFLHLFYPITKKLSITKSDLQERVEAIEDELKIKQPSVLRELLNLPCFFMDPSCLTDIKHQFIHKFSLPFNFDIDAHTIDVLPPIVDLKKSGISLTQHCSNKANDKILGALPTFQINNLLDYTYPSHNGKGSPECLSNFLVQAELEEDKDRTGGQPLKGRRGFNVPPRQY